MSFFTKKEIQTTNSEGINRKLSCYACGLYKGDITSPKMQPFGEFKKGILNIGEFSTNIDDLRGKPFQGENKGIYSVYSKLGIDIEKDCINVNSVMCYSSDKKTGKDKPPTPLEINCCRVNMIKIIKQYKPKLIMLFGKIALLSIVGDKWKGSLDGIEKWRGFVIPEQTYGCWVAPVYSPAFVKNLGVEANLIWEQDIRNALDYLEVPFPAYQKPKITVLKELDALSEIKHGSTISFDYETTGLKPHDKGHRIVCASVAINENEVFVFEMPKSVEKRKPFVDLLKNKHIEKSAHNIKFEETWSLIRLKTRISNWVWDTMLVAHILDNRSGVTSLKFQTYINFGIADYNSHMEKILQGEDDKNANSKNKLIEFFSTPKGKAETLEYCALDSIFQYRLHLKQKKVVDNILPF